MVITGEGRAGPDIWPETPEQAENTIRTTWDKEVHRKRKASGIKMCPLSHSGKEARYICSFF